MGRVDVQRAFRSMTLPPRTGEPHEWPASIAIETTNRVGIPVGPEAEPECTELANLAEGERDVQVRQAVELMAAILDPRPMPLSVVLDLVACTLDIPLACAEGLFWRAHEHGYVSLREGVVHLEKAAASH